MQRNVIRWANEVLNSTLWLIGGAWPKRTGRGPVLVIRPDLIGDFLLFTPALEPLRRRYEGRRIVLVVQKSVAALLEGCPHVDQVIPLEEQRFRRAPFYRLAILRRIRRIGATTTLYPCYSRTGVGDMLVAWSAAAERIGWDSDAHHLSPWEKVRGDKHYTQLVVGRVPPDQHEIERNLHFLRELGATAGSRATAVWFPVSAVQGVSRCSDPNTLRIALLPGASFAVKKWGAERFNSWMRLMAERAGERCLTFVICGQAGDDAGLLTTVTANVEVVNLAGATSLVELAGVFASCALVVGNDTGTMHLAIALGLPTVCILGGGHYGRFMPYHVAGRQNVFLTHPLGCFQCGWNCSRPSPECITFVTPEQVADKAAELLASSACVSR